MSETYEGILRRIALRMGELAREDEWNNRLVMVSDEMMTPSSCLLCG